MKRLGAMIGEMFVLILASAVATTAAAATNMQAAKGLYDQHCASCHGLDGRGRFADVPDLRTAGLAAMPGFQAVNKLKLGSTRKPPFLGRLTDQQLMDTLIYASTLK